ncbi:MAG TPA: phosphoserine phosphatase SerB [Hyphomonadaceae bacterium]|jgi:phosphoserine phosphatase|nr:phosphoserine phosphatase SerB [Hyphomonadaceae bacterium]
MNPVLTLVSRSSGALKLANTAPGGLGAAAERGGRHWSVTEREIDVKRESDLIAYLDAEAAGAQIDWAIAPQANRRKKLLISDMDSTIIGQECLDELADFAGFKAEVSAITERAMRGELDFASALRTRVALLKGLDLSALEKCYAERVTLNPGARELTATMKAHGARCVLVSGGFRFFTSRVAKAAGFDTDRANTLNDDGKVLLGTVGEPILGREAKLVALKEEAAAIGATPADALAMGDGANDLDMIRAAGLGIAYKAKPIVAAETKARIQFTDLTAALFFQGYAESDFVTA